MVGLFQTWTFLKHFCKTCRSFIFYLRHFNVFLHHFMLMVKNTFSHIPICMFDKIVKRIILVLHLNKKKPFLTPKNAKFKP